MSRIKEALWDEINEMFSKEEEKKLPKIKPKYRCKHYIEEPDYTEIREVIMTKSNLIPPDWDM